MRYKMCPFAIALVALPLTPVPTSAGTVETTVFEPCQVVDQAAYDAFEPRARLREPRIDSFGFEGEVRGPKDGLQVVQLQFGSTIAWFDSPAKAKVTHKETGQTLYFISPLRDGMPNSIRLVVSNGAVECGWPEKLR